MNIGIVLNGESKLDLNLENINYWIAVDGGYNMLVEQNIKPDILIGDLDSIKYNDYKCDVLKFDKTKDESDFELALEFVNEKFNNFNITVYNYKSKFRIEHFYANLKLIKPGIMFKDEYSIIGCLSADNHIIKKEYKFISFFAITNISKLCLTGLKYELNNKDISTNQIFCISNEFINHECNVSFSNGKLIYIQSKEETE